MVDLGPTRYGLRMVGVGDLLVGAGQSTLLGVWAVSGPVHPPVSLRLVLPGITLLVVVVGVPLIEGEGG